MKLNNKIIFIISFIFSLILATVLQSPSQNALAEGLLNKLLAPGPLTKSHADLEGKDCLKCHEAGKGVNDSLCLECHKEIRPFIENKVGFHGLKTQNCSECHGEHKGADFNSIEIDIKNFDHASQTGYRLSGKHAEIKCDDCHKEKFKALSVHAGHMRFFGKQASCVSCHKKDDPHAFKGAWSKKDCNACHEMKSWKENAHFDHARDTHFKLVGQHAQLKCAECHGPSKSILISKYSWPKLKTQQCLTCHQDFHKKNLSHRYQSGNCITCHTQDKWKIENFEHKVTGYSLNGKHAAADCQQCHVQKTKGERGERGEKGESVRNFNFTGLKTNCLACHKDEHKFANLKLGQHQRSAQQCAICHSEQDWKKTHDFDHARDARYPLDGQHAQLKCVECHLIRKGQQLKVGIYSWPHLQKKTCAVCHDSPHLKSFSPTFLAKSCTECHVTSGWYDMKSGVKFDHGKTRFALTGSHQDLKCSQCHGEKGKQTFRFPSAESKFCVDCHKNIHLENNQFSSALLKESNNCSVCHTSQNFKERLSFDHNRTRYPLFGAHKSLKCAECHKASAASVQLSSKSAKIQLGQYMFPHVTPQECLSCHADYHQGQLSSKCLECHSSKLDTWKNPRFDHNTQSNFMLRDKHSDLKCSECHRPISKTFISSKEKSYPVIRYKPLDTQCMTCHKDPHSGSFGSRCKECHTERGWRITRDFHKNFTLSGVHYSLSCAECHQDGRKLSGLSQQCLTCHIKDDIHNATLPNCQDCHRQQYWEIGQFRHSLTLFPLRGAHRGTDCVECHRNGQYRGLSPECWTCHKQDALNASSPQHMPFANFINCTNCHISQFTFQRR